MVIIKNKIVLTFLIVFSLLFVAPYVDSFSLGDLGDVVGYVLFNSFDVISGHAPLTSLYNECDDSEGDECATGGGGDLGICGNGIKEEGEGCDAGNDTIFGTDDDDFGLFPDCEARSHDGGTLICEEGCVLNQDHCYDFDDGDCESDYGETAENSPEDCINCADYTCAEAYENCQGEQTSDCGEGEECTFINVMGSIITSCSPIAGAVSCGDGVIEGDEVCDGDDLGVSSCVTEGFDGGTLSCESDCLSFDTDECTYAEDDDTNPAENTPSGGDDNDRTSLTVAVDCAAINGICTDECGVNYEHYNGTNNLDEQCQDDYGDGLICCVPSYILDAGYYSENGDYQDSLNDEDDFTGTVKSVEDYMIQKEQEAAMSAPSYALEGGLQQILTSPSYAMGGVWIIFVLSSIIIGMTYYLHANFGSKLKIRRRK